MLNVTNKKPDSSKPPPLVSRMPWIKHDSLGHVSYEHIHHVLDNRIRRTHKLQARVQHVLILGHASHKKACRGANKPWFGLIWHSFLRVSSVVSVWELLAKGLRTFGRWFKKQVFCFFSFCIFATAVCMCNYFTSLCIYSLLFYNIHETLNKPTSWSLNQTRVLP